MSHLIVNKKFYNFIYSNTLYIIDYKNKYFKYKTKYLKYKKELIGSADSTNLEESTNESENELYSKYYNVILNTQKEIISKMKEKKIKLSITTNINSMKFKIPNFEVYLTINEFKPKTINGNVDSKINVKFIKSPSKNISSLGLMFDVKKETGLSIKPISDEDTLKDGLRKELGISDPSVSNKLNILLQVISLCIDSKHKQDEKSEDKIKKIKKDYEELKKENFQIKIVNKVMINEALEELEQEKQEKIDKKELEKKVEEKIKNNNNQKEDAEV